MRIEVWKYGEINPFLVMECDYWNLNEDGTLILSNETFKLSIPVDFYASFSEISES
jgi:hypothetical protein